MSQYKADLTEFYYLQSYMTGHLHYFDKYLI